MRVERKYFLSSLTILVFNFDYYVTIHIYILFLRQVKDLRKYHVSVWKKKMKNDIFVFVKMKTSTTKLLDCEDLYLKIKKEEDKKYLFLVGEKKSH